MQIWLAFQGVQRDSCRDRRQYLNQRSSNGVGYRSFTQPYLDSFGMFKDAVVAVLLTIAKQERVRIGDRVRARVNRARVHGTSTGRAVGRTRAILDRQRVIELRRTGLSWRQIARKLGVGVTTVRRAWQDAQGRQYS